MEKSKSAKSHTKAGKLKDLPTKSKRAAAVKGGLLPPDSIIKGKH